MADPHICLGCTEPDDKDHYHQYVNAFGDLTSSWFIDGQIFRDPSEALTYLEDVLECTSHEALLFIERIPKRYD